MIWILFAAVATLVLFAPRKPARSGRAPGNPMRAWREDDRYLNSKMRHQRNSHD
jgi:hypothetical protein